MRRSFLKCLPLLMMASWAIAEQCQITSPLPVPVSISGCTFAANTLPPGSTGYIQNLLTPTTTTQTFSVQVATVTDKFTESALGGSGTQCVQVDNTGLFTASGTGACGSGGGGGGGGYAVEPATVTFNLAKGFTSSTGSITGVAGASVTYGLAVGSMTASSATVAGQLTAGTYQGAGLINCGSTSQAVSWGSGSYGCTTITPAGIGAITGNQNISVSGDSSGSGTTAITLTAAATQGNITTFTSPITITSSETVTYGVIASSVAASSMTASGQITAGSLLLNTPLPVAGGGTGTASPGLVPGTNITSITGTWPNQTINAATQSGGGGGGTPLAVTTGTQAGFATVGSSPTLVIVHDQSQFLTTLQGSATAFVAIAYSTNSLTASYTTTSTDTVVMENCASACTATLATPNYSGKIIRVIQAGAGNVTIAFSSGNLQPSGQSTILETAQGESIDLLWDKNNWWIQ